MERDELFKIVEIEINSYCNLACSYCPNREYQRKEKGDMALSDYLKIIDQLVELGFKGRISHEFYGEPTLHPDYDEIIRTTKERLPQCKIELYSNATRLTKERIEGLFERGLDEILVTIHEGQEHLPIREIHQELKQDYQKRLVIRDHERIYKTNRGGCLPDVGGVKQPLLPCRIPDFLITITVEGNVLPCFEDFFQNHEMGNVFKTPLKEIWNAPEYIQLRRDLRHGLRHKYKTCENCNRIQTLEPDENYFQTSSQEK